ncbi:hypothetical protein T265_06585 [Opisthorchis viverrini]|uniref:Uncharacterized protein n=1 Tax=Opisthorchis viverrini TaxID=6198 RepID=A0A074ZRY0_OPIVI|nr:hypothetical protein T265_06585 [Opisthorchis viverrini]KER26105.1 hypothetical protein T265_06585 [Opisthorchis viverrini]
MLHILIAGTLIVNEVFEGENKTYVRLHIQQTPFVVSDVMIVRKILLKDLQGYMSTMVARRDV